MAGYSAYVHSNINNIEKDNGLSVSVDLIDNMNGVDNRKGETYVQYTIDKLENIKKALDLAADQFLKGYSIEEAQRMADNNDELLVQIANEALFGVSNNELATSLIHEQIIKKEDLEKIVEPEMEELKNQILAEIGDQATVSEVARIITKNLSGSGAKITVSEASVIVSGLGKLFNVQSFKSAGKEIELEANKTIFKKAKNFELSKERSGRYREVVRDLLKASKLTDVKKRKDVISRFCENLQRKMEDIANTKVLFQYGEKDTLKPAIGKFIEKLEDELDKSLKDVQGESLSERSNAVGAIGEQVREAVRQAGNSTILSFTIGDVKDELGVERVNKKLEEAQAKTISKMQDYRKEEAQSLTDVVLLNTKTGEVARAQSKNHFTTYFNKEYEDENVKEADKTINNFRWTVQNNTQLLGFLEGLSKTELGMNLNDFDMRNIMEAMANNVWFQYHKSAFPVRSEHKGFNIGFKEATVQDFQKELEGSLERMLSGQITSLLGVSVNKENNNEIISNASNIFYLLNGRMKRTSELIQQAINQLKASENFKMENKGRMVIVNINTSEAKIDPGNFLPDKLRSLERYNENGKTAWRPTGETESIGEDMGEEVFKGIKIKVSLGTDIKALRTTSLNGLM